MARYIDADKLISHLEDEIKGCAPLFGGRLGGKTIAYGTILGMKSAISFANTLQAADVVPRAEYEELIAKKVLKEAIETFGMDMQLNIAIEEFAELTKEICKYKRGADNISHIIEEMADCYIMLEQMKIMFALGSTIIGDAMDKKIERLEQRLAELKKKYTEGEE